SSKCPKLQKFLASADSGAAIALQGSREEGRGGCSLERIYTVVLREPWGCRLGGGGDASTVERRRCQSCHSRGSPVRRMNSIAHFATLARSVMARGRRSTWCTFSSPRSGDRYCARGV